MQALPRKSVGWVVVLCSSLFLGALLAGCETTHHMAKNHDVMCPLCQMPTRATAADGLVYAKHVCPKCHTVRDTGTWDEKADLTEVHVCDRCKATVEKCPMCRKH